jgi:hypothetical protein
MAKTAREIINPFLQEIIQKFSKEEQKQMVATLNTLPGYPNYHNLKQIEIPDDQQDIMKNKEFIEWNIKTLKLYITSLSKNILDVSQLNSEIIFLIERAKTTNEQEFFELLILFFTNYQKNSDFLKVPVLEMLIELDQINSLKFMNTEMSNDTISKGLVKILKDIFFNEGKEIEKWGEKLEEELKLTVQKKSVAMQFRTDFSNKLREYYEGMKFLGLIFIGLFDLIEGYPGILKKEYKLHKIGSIYQNIVKFSVKSKKKTIQNPVDSRKSRKNLYDYCQKYTEYPELTKFIHLLFDRIRKVRNIISHSKNIVKEITENPNGLNDEIEFFMPFAQLLTMIPILIQFNLMRFAV